VCRQKALHEVAIVSPTTNSTAAQFWLDSILKMFSQNVDFKIDTGADVSVMHAKAYEALRFKHLLETASIELMSPGGTVSTTGQF